MKRECTHGYRAVETAVSIGGGAGQSSHGTDVVVSTGDVLSGRGDRVAMVVAEQEPELNLGMSGSSLRSWWPRWRISSSYRRAVAAVAASGMGTFSSSRGT